MGTNVHTFNEKFDFEIEGVSYIGAPRPGTVMFVTCKIKELIFKLEKVAKCLVFAEKGISVPDKISAENCIVFTESPQRDYADFVTKFAALRLNREKSRRYTMTDGGYYIGENVVLGENAYIEPGCLIGHDVVIGKNACILSGAVIKNAVIGDDFWANEKALIGTNGFTMTEDAHGNKMRIPALGKVIIGNHVEIGAQDAISRGSGGDTRIDDYVKTDALVYLGHDVSLARNVEIAAGGILGGFVTIGANCYVGSHAVIRNRVDIGEHAAIGMGANVTKPVLPNVTVAGNPAKLFTKKGQ